MVEEVHGFGQVIPRRHHRVGRVTEVTLYPGARTDENRITGTTGRVHVAQGGLRTMDSRFQCIFIQGIRQIAVVRIIGDERLSGIQDRI